VQAVVAILAHTAPVDVALGFGNRINRHRRRRFARNWLRSSRFGRGCFFAIGAVRGRVG
jgi:hypothetical protein